MQKGRVRVVLPVGGTGAERAVRVGPKTWYYYCINTLDLAKKPEYL